MSFLRKFSVLSFVISSLFVANVGAAGPAPAHQRGASVLSRHRGPARARRLHPLVSATIMGYVYKVHECEWHFNWSGNSGYPDGIGMTLANYLEFRAPSFPMNPAVATPQQQGWVLSHFLGFHHMAWPHQGWPMYCGGGY